MSAKKIIWSLMIIIALSVYIFGFIAVSSSFEKPINDIRNYALNFDSKNQELISKKNNLIVMREKKYNVYKSLLQQVYEAELKLKIQELSNAKQSEINAQLEKARQQQLQQQLLAQQLAAQQQAQASKVQQVAKPVTRIVRRKVRKTRAS